MEKLEKLDHQDNSMLLIEKPSMNQTMGENVVKTKIINITENALDLHELKNNNSNNSDNDSHKVEEHKILVINE